MKRTAALLALLAGGLAGAEATEVQVGRTRIELPFGDWLPVMALQTDPDGNGAANPLHTRIYRLDGAGATPRALLVVSSTGHASSGGSASWSSQHCPPARPRYYTNDYGSSQLRRARECLIVNPDFVAAAYFRDDARVQAALAAENIALPRRAVSLRAESGGPGGTLLRVNLIADRSFTGLPRRVPDAVYTYGVEPALVSWGELLHEGVHRSVHGMLGRLQLPPLDFEAK